jgi:hypothetical protein
MRITGITIRNFGSIRCFEACFKGDIISIYDAFPNSKRSDFINVLIVLLRNDYIKGEWVYSEMAKLFTPDTFIQGVFSEGKDTFTVILKGNGLECKYAYEREVYIHNVRLPNDFTFLSEIISNDIIEYIYPRELLRNAYFEKTDNYYCYSIKRLIRDLKRKSSIKQRDWHELTVNQVLDLIKDFIDGFNEIEICDGKTMRIGKDGLFELVDNLITGLEKEEEVLFNYYSFLSFQNLQRKICQADGERSLYPIFIDGTFDLCDRDFYMQRLLEETRKTERQTLIITYRKDPKLKRLCDEFFE